LAGTNQTSVIEYLGAAANFATIGIPVQISSCVQSFSRARRRLPAPSNSTRQRLYGVSFRNASLPN